MSHKQHGKRFRMCEGLNYLELVVNPVGYSPYFHMAIGCDLCLQECSRFTNSDNNEHHILLFQGDLEVTLVIVYD